MRILICTDGKKHSQEAIKFCGLLFQKISPEVTVMHIRPKKNPEESLDKAKSYLRDASKILAKFNIKPKKVLIENGIVQEIKKEIKKGKYHLLVIGSRGPSSVLRGVTETVLKSTAQSIVKVSDISLLVVKDPPKILNRILLCTDGSVNAELAINFWGRLPKKYEPKVTILNIIPALFTRFQDELISIKEDLLKVLIHSYHPQAQVVNRGKDILERYGIETEIKLREKEYAAEEILAEEKESDYDLIVMG